MRCKIRVKDIMNFEDKFMEIQVDMISLAMEYVQNQAEKIFIYLLRC